MIIQQRNDTNVKVSVSELKLHITICIMRCISLSPLPNMIAFSYVYKIYLIITTVEIPLIIMNEETFDERGDG